MNNIVSGIMGNTLRRYLIVALVASLAVTGGMFAYGYTTDVTTITGTDRGWDFGNVTYNVTGAPAAFEVWGNYRGKIGAGTLFTVHHDTNFSGDITVNVYLSNLDELSWKYGMLLLRIAFVDPSNLTDYQDVEGIEKPLTLNNGMVSFTCDNISSLADHAVYLKGGVYRAFPWAYLSAHGSDGSFDPQLTCEIVQAGLDQ